MIDWLPPEKRSKIMRSIRSNNTKPEIIARKIAHSLGFRFRLHRWDLPGKPDLVFPRLKKVVFVHGCFWHQHDNPNCSIAQMPSSNLEYWKPKFKRTKTRDKERIVALKKLGWSTLIIWECDTQNMLKTTKKIKNFLNGRRL